MKFAPKSALLALALAASVSSAHAYVVTYNDFSNTTGLTMAGSAAVATTADGAVLRVTPATGNQSGAAYSTTAVTLGVNSIFSTQFQFRITETGGINPADGFTFVLAANPTGLGSGGGGLGYAGVGNSVAVEFDTFNNGTLDADSSNHVAVDVNGSLASAALNNVYGRSTCTFSSGSSHADPGCLSNGDLWTASISYDGSALTATLLDPAKGTLFQGIGNFPIDIAAALGTNQVYVGFTSGTGAGYANHDIVNWQFSDTTQLAQIPVPATLPLLGIGMLALARTRRKSQGSAPAA
ncbi:PEP-CTERM sorting domain-containing protein [Noviherbaspirillum galbum]|uniref:PEP-CTERM sorting domain-containing protein n=1 Tax=Noviherbaspirillum galbum TaxID=2709383 RepID=A0A6B3SJA8_9BURK|nr:PEP-CTERM sorting domain-containing protein [Noviherbaspirillum galbum]NEX60658.1 PEP-CTERM sorting domain-containing protein [Noviherbaspirillum galbum]